MTRRLLLLDDDLAGRMTLAALLEDAGYQVVEAESLANAREQLGEGSFDVALLDQKLPDGRGTELVGELKVRHPRIVVGVLSGSDPERVAGVELYLVKGQALPDLLAAIEGASSAQPAGGAR